MAEQQQEHPESRKTSEWRRNYWSMVNREQGGAPLPVGLNTDEKQTSWKLVDETQEATEAEQRGEQDGNIPPSFTSEEAARLEQEASKPWNEFYNHFEDNFFKDRNYLSKEFPEVFVAAERKDHSASILEIGCGVGNTALPLLSAFSSESTAKIYAFDFSSRAIEVLKAREGYNPNRIEAFVGDITDISTITSHVKPGSIDVAMAIFALSAISPLKLPMALNVIKTCLSPNGCLLIRDYAVGDIAQLRFIAKSGRKIEDHFYLRGDQTRVFFFSKASATKLFTDAGFVIETMKYDTRVLKNRKRDFQMHRVWLQAKLTLSSHNSQQLRQKQQQSQESTSATTPSPTTQPTQ